MSLVFEFLIVWNDGFDIWRSLCENFDFNDIKIISDVYYLDELNFNLGCDIVALMCGNLVALIYILDNGIS